MQQEKFWELLSLKITGEATNEELDALNKLLSENPEFSFRAQILSQLLANKRDMQIELSKEFLNKHLQRLSNRPDTVSDFDNNSKYNITSPIDKPSKGKLKMIKWIFPVAGVAAMLVVAIKVFETSPVAEKTKKEKEIGYQNIVVTRKGLKSNLQLPDGSKAWLNADSKLTYGENFGDRSREVSLAGEAYFDVVKDKTKPFIIHTKTIDIKVLGTAFNVKAYDKDDSTETSLFRGSLEVSLHDKPHKKIVLKPNEKLLISNKYFLSWKSDTNNDSGENELMTLRKVHFQKNDSGAMESLWVKNKLVFDSENLEEVARKIERWYNVEVDIEGDDELKHSEYTGVFENENLSQVMLALKMTGNFKYSINKKVVTIY